ncbi:hypothetical protein [Prevotella melaninogenica]
MLDVEQVKKLFLLYNYKIERLEKEYLVFSYSNPYDAVEIVPILGMEKQEIERIQSEFQEAGYAVKVNNCKNIEEIENYLFNLFFHVEASNKRNRQKYSNYVDKIMEPYNRRIKQVPSAELKKYEYINISYLLEENFMLQPTSIPLIDSLQKDIAAMDARLLIVEAAAGFGKTSTVYELLDRLSIPKVNIRPFLMELSKDRSASTFRYLLLSQIEENFDITLKANVVIHNIQKGRIPLILDGFDELLSKDLDNGNSNPDFKEVESMLYTIVSLLKDHAKIVLTTRKTAIFSGETFYEWYLKHSVNQSFSVSRYQLQEPSAQEWLPKQRLESLVSETLRALENPVLLGYLRYIDDSNFSKIQKTNSLVNSYFDFLLRREIERQNLPFSVREQLDIFEKLSLYFAGFDISSDSRENVKGAIAELAAKEIINNVSIQHDESTLTNALTNHALLDRKENGNIGFINDFIFINLLSISIKDINDSYVIFFQNEISYSLLEKIIFSASTWNTKNRELLYKALLEKCKLNSILKFWADVKLTDRVNDTLLGISLEGNFIKSVYFGIDDVLITKCTFSNISFLGCYFNFNNISECTFINCSFDHDCEKDGISSECEFYNCEDKQNKIVEVIDEAKEVDCIPTIDNFDKSILAKYFQVDNRSRRMRMISKIREEYDFKVFKKHFSALVKNKYIFINGDKSFITDLGVSYYITL